MVLTPIINGGVSTPGTPSFPCNGEDCPPADTGAIKIPAPYEIPVFVINPAIKIKRVSAQLYSVEVTAYFSAEHPVKGTLSLITGLYPDVTIQARTPTATKSGKFVELSPDKKVLLTLRTQVYVPNPPRKGAVIIEFSPAGNGSRVVFNRDIMFADESVVITPAPKTVTTQEDSSTAQVANETDKKKLLLGIGAGLVGLYLIWRYVL